MCGTCENAIPAATLKLLRDEILSEVARISHSGTLSPQERTLFRIVVERTIDGETSQLYQKALADVLDISNPKQVGVVATRIRAKLAEYYAQTAAESSLQISLSDRGYEAFVTYRQPSVALSDRAQIAVANAKAALDQRTLPGAAAALKHLHAALDLEPGHQLLLSLKALCHATRALYGTYPRADLEAADQILSATRTSQPRPWESWFAEGCVLMTLRWDWAGAETAFERAIALSGGAARRLPWYTAFLASQGRARDAVPLLRTAVSQAHDSPIVRADLASNQILAGDYDGARETIETAFALFGERTHYLLHVHRAILLEATGDAAAAARAITQVPLKWPQTAITLGLRALFSGLAGDRRTARRHFTKLRAARAVTGHHFIPAGQLSIAALGAGDIPAAIDWLRAGALVDRDPNLVLVNVYPFFRHIHGHPEFKALVCDTMGLRLPPS